MRHLLLTISYLVLLVAVIACVWLLVFDIPDAVRPLLVNRLEAATGREVSIGGDLEMKFSLAPTVTAGDVTLANAPWGSRPNMLAVDRLDVQFQLLPLLFDRELVIDRLQLSGVDLLLERNKSGIGNWRFRSQAEKPPNEGTPTDERRRTLPFLADVAVDDALLTWRDLAQDKSRTVQLDSFHWTSESASAPVEVGAQGEWRERPFDISGTVGAMDALPRSEGEWPVDFSGTLGEAEIAATGSLGLGEAETRVQLSVSGDRLALAAEILGLQLPTLGPYDLEATLVGNVGSLRLANIQGAMGRPETLEISIEDGKVSSIGSSPELTVPFRARTEQAARVAALFDLPMPFPGGGTISGELTNSAQPGLAVRGLSVELGQGANQFMLEGEITGLPDAARLDLSVDADVESLSVLDEPGGPKLPPAGPVSLTAQVAGQWPEITLSDIALHLGENSVTGRLSLDLAATPPSVNGQLSSERFDVAAVTQEFASDQPEADRERGGLPVDALTKLAADIDLTAQTLLIAGREAGPASARLRLHDGQLSLEEIDLRILGGAVSGSAVAEAVQTDAPARPLARIDLQLRAENLELGRLIGAPDGRAGSDIEVDAQLTANSTGRSVNELIGQLDGNAAAIAADGRLQGIQISRLVQDLDPMRLLLPFWRSAEVVPINCMVADMDIEQGVADTQFMVDTRRMTLLGEGTVNLRSRQLDLSIEPRPKSSALSATGVPVDITGSISSPEVEPRPGATAARLFGGLLGGLLVPLNQIARIFGEEARNACAGALESAADAGGVAEE